MSEYRKLEIADWYDQHSKSILSFILLMVKDYQQAEDLTGLSLTLIERYILVKATKKELIGLGLTFLIILSQLLWVIFFVIEQTNVLPKFRSQSADLFFMY